MWKYDCFTNTYQVDYARQWAQEQYIRDLDILVPERTGLSFRDTILDYMMGL